MGDKFVATVRFHTEGVEAELYRRLMDGKREAGLSMPDYIKQILKEYFEDRDRRDKQDGWLGQFRREMAADIEQAVRESIRKYNMSNAGATVLDSAVSDNSQKEAELPAQSEEMPEGALDFLDGIC